jgi:hypothetical protein
MRARRLLSSRTLSSKDPYADSPARHRRMFIALKMIGLWSCCERDAISAVPEQVWGDAVDADGGHRDGAGLAEITGLLPARVLADYHPAPE